MEFKIVFSQKIGRFKLYNFDLNVIYIISWHHTDKYIWIYFFIQFPYILTLTSPLPFVCWTSGTFWADGFNSNVAQLDYTFYLIYMWSRGCLQLHRQQFSWRWYQKTDFGFGLTGLDYPRDDRERSKIRL